MHKKNLQVNDITAFTLINYYTSLEMTTGVSSGLTDSPIISCDVLDISVPFDLQVN